MHYLARRLWVNIGIHFLSLSNASLIDCAMLFTLSTS